MPENKIIEEETTKKILALLDEDTKKALSQAAVVLVSIHDTGCEIDGKVEAMTIEVGADGLTHKCWKVTIEPLFSGGR